jgi:hypothetical protein
MDERNTTDERYQSARRQVQSLRAFYQHAIVFGLVNAGLFVVDLLTGDGWWFYWPLLGWGIALAIQAVTVFGGVSLFGADWEERKTREIVERERRGKDG